MYESISFLISCQQTSWCSTSNLFACPGCPASAESWHSLINHYCSSSCSWKFNFSQFWICPLAFLHQPLLSPSYPHILEVPWWSFLELDQLQMPQWSDQDSCDSPYQADCLPTNAIVLVRSAISELHQQILHLLDWIYSRYCTHKLKKWNRGFPAIWHCFNILECALSWGEAVFKRHDHCTHFCEYDKVHQTNGSRFLWQYHKSSLSILLRHPIQSVIAMIIVLALCV